MGAPAFCESVSASMSARVFFGFVCVHSLLVRCATCQAQLKAAKEMAEAKAKELQGKTE